MYLLFLWPWKDKLKFKFILTIYVAKLINLMARKKQQDVWDLLGAMYTAVMFLGTQNTMGVQPIVDIERTVLYRERAAGMYSTLTYAISQVQTYKTRHNFVDFKEKVTNPNCVLLVSLCIFVVRQRFPS